MRIAIVGSGISGLAAAWLLGRRHAVTLFESSARAGGHTNTVDVTLDGRTHGVDTGFLVFNRATYPRLVALFSHLGMPIAASEMSFSLSLEAPRLEWAGNDLSTVFAQKRNLLRPGFLRMLRDIVRFNREAGGEQASGSAESLGDFLQRRRYSNEFRDWYLLPMAAAIWSCPTMTMLDYPCGAFVRFFRNHGLLALRDRPQWLTIAGGARQYVDRLLHGVRDLRLSTRVTQVDRHDDGVLVSSVRAVPGLPRAQERFDGLVLACHSDQALAILGNGASALERSLLGSISYQSNRAVLHTDTGVLPRDRRVWAAWNYSAGHAGPQGRPVSVHYLTNRLQPLPFDRPVIVSLNPHRQPQARDVIASFDYAHPVFGTRSTQAQATLAALQGNRRTWFCGAWTRYGFHEDGLRSAIAVAGLLGVQPPWMQSEEPAWREAA